MWIGSAPAFLLASLVWLLFVTSGEEIGWLKHWWHNTSRSL